MAKLIFILDDEQEIEVPLPQQVTVGRQEGNDVVVDDPRISSRHAVIVRDRQGNYEVRDLGSKAGTFVNGVRSEKRVLHPGDKLSFGPLKCLFLMEPTEKPVPMGNPPAGRVGHPVLTGILESTSVGVAAEQEGPRLTGNAFSGGLSDDDAPAPGGAPRQQGGGSGTFVAPRPTQPHPSVSSPRSLRDEPVERKSAASSKPAAKGASGMLKSLLRTVGAIKPVEPEDDLPPAARNTVTPRTMPPQRDERLRTTSPGTGASRASRFQETDTSFTQRATSHSHETSSGVKPLAGINHGPQPKGAVPQGQPGVDASGDVIERVPVYTYAVQPKTRQAAPEESPAQPHNLVPAAPQVQIPPASQPSVVSPLAPSPVAAPESNKGGLSPLPPMPTGMARPALPPLPPLPASLQAAAVKPAPSTPAGNPDFNTPASESLPQAPIQTQISGPKVRINTGTPASPGANIPVAAAAATPVLGASPLSRVLSTPLKVSSTPSSAPAIPAAVAPTPAAVPSEPKVAQAVSSPVAEVSPPAIRPVVSLTPPASEVFPTVSPSTPVSDSKSAPSTEPKPTPPSSPSEASSSSHAAPVLEAVPVKLTSSAFDLPPIVETSELETPVAETKDKSTSEETAPGVDKVTPAPESSAADPKQSVSVAPVASAPGPAVVPALVPVKAEAETSSVPLLAESGSSSPPALPTE
ncbi:MAG: FHA domain-containing protein, partial [Verrucomicrobium sp.]|nr:FHA domain-containing protein [Verrucomicrobium sp.]